MATVADTLAHAATFLGYTEGPGKNETPFGAWAGCQGAPWCHAFTSKVLHDVGESIGKLAYCPAGVVFFREKQQLFAEPRPGDLFYQWRFVEKEKRHRYAHTGFVRAVDGKKIVTIEGNSNTAGSRTGGSVVSLKREWPGTKMVFGRPAYEDVAVKPAMGPFHLMPVVAEEYPPEGGLVLFAENGDSYNFLGAPQPPKRPGFRTFDQPIVMSPIVDAKQAPGEKGGWLLGQDGGVYAFGTRPHGCPHGQSYWSAGGQRTAARLEVPGDGGAAYTVVASSGERYTYPYT